MFMTYVYLCGEASQEGNLDMTVADMYKLLRLSLYVMTPIELLLRQNQ